MLDALKFAALFGVEARLGRFSILGDFIYLDLGSKSSAVRSVDFVQAGQNPVSASLNAGTKSELNGTLVTLAGAYTVTAGTWGNVDLLGGLRYLGLSATTDIQLTANVVGPGVGQVLSRTGRLSDDAHLLDGIIGLRGRINLGAGFYIPYAADIGAGSSAFTWQALAGVGYQTGWAGVTLGYRHLSYEQGSDKLVQDLSLSGPFLSASFRF